MLRGWLLGLVLWGGGFYGALAAQPACEAEQAFQHLLECAVEAAPPGVEKGDLRWLHLSLSTKTPLDRLLALGVPDARHVELWLAPPGQTAERKWRLDGSAKFADRPYLSNRLAFPLALSPGRTEVWVGYRLHADGKLSPRLLSPMEVRALETRTDLLIGGIAGILLTLLIGVLAVRLVGRSSGYGTYAALVLFALMWLGQTEGYNFALLWPESPRWNHVAPILLSLAVLASHAGFALRFLQLRQRFGRLWRLHLAFLLACALGAPLVVLFEKGSLLGPLLGFIYCPLALFTAFSAWRARLAGSPLYLLGVLSFMLFGVVLFGLGVVGLNPFPRLDFFNYPKLGMLVESCCFAAALVNRLRLQQQQLADERLHRLAAAEELLALESERRAALEMAHQQGLRLAGASHDISQPLASLRFAIEALRRQDANPAITQHLDHTVAYAQTLLSDLIQQTQRDLPATVEPLSLGPLLAQVAAQHQAQAKAKGLKLRIAPCTATFRGSELIVSRILNNLLTNALRYTDRGGVLLGVRRRPGGLEIQVLDTGPGLMPDQLERLQRPFERGDSEQAGHGLGLFIVKQLCTQCGYQLSIHTRMGRGSCFAITVPTVSP